MKRVRPGNILRCALLSLCVAAAGCAAVPGARECGTPRALPAALADTDLIIVGEIHGTTETPRFVGDLACALLARGKAVTVGFEMSHDLTGDLHAFLDSDGGPAARSDLLGSMHWSREARFQDGRASQAMYDLIERARRLRRAGADLTLAAFDLPTQIPGTVEERRRIFAERDKRMAQQASLLVRPNQALILLVGNLHAVKYAEESPYPAKDKMASLMAQSSVVIAARYRAGTYWACVPGGCGVQEATGHYSDPSQDGTIILQRKEGFDGFAYLGPVSASAPARAAPGGDARPR